VWSISKINIKHSWLVSDNIAQVVICAFACGYFRTIPRDYCEGYEKIVSYFSDTAEDNKKCVVSSGI
jgi:hypothetical protein